ncbi:hypothetical protein ACA342_33275 (plasmid) [Pseudomonas aeruginosa]|uniref:hypothetical protein n=1 Tax=Pseudomonas aeruginosa TaxID=287 RepID=UPI001FF6372A|nr:hypothetical protein [Pseudomonas aeruginosa]MCK0982478.1 hypothetical protein [Pseudomonas aeruginosa]MCL8242874.1 hypothetical protein [Pseudomonas aeruginosa]
MAKPEIDWLVYVNGVEVGQVPHEEMERITATVKRDWVVYVSQGVEVLKTALRMLKLAVMCAPAVALLLGDDRENGKNRTLSVRPVRLRP